jgi:hypothetical protein
MFSPHRVHVILLTSLRYVIMYRWFYLRGLTAAVSSEPYAMAEEPELPSISPSQSSGSSSIIDSNSKEDGATNQRRPGYRLFGAKHALTVQDYKVRR